MAKRRWTVVLVPHGSEPSRILEVSYGVLKMAAGGAGMALVAVLLVGYATVSRSADLSRSSRLQHENARLARELGELHGRLATLSDTIIRIAQRDERIRVLANLEPIDPPAAGVVIDAGWESGYGNTVTIDHGYGLVTKYAHASKLLVKAGQRVSRGQRIALVGN